jgi:class 3 adenylate cyclase
LSIQPDKEVNNITVLGDTPNVAARLSSLARQGEILVTDTAYTAAAIAAEGLGSRQVELKGRQEPMKIWSTSSPAG